MCRRRRRREHHFVVKIYLTSLLPSLRSPILHIYIVDVCPLALYVSHHHLSSASTPQSHYEDWFDECKLSRDTTTHYSAEVFLACSVVGRSPP